jgi:imidazolonepropionase-like amidohydrolase
MMRLTACCLASLVLGFADAAPRNVHRLRAPAQSTLAIEHVNVVDVETGTVLPDRTVLIVGERVARVGRSREVTLDAHMPREDGRGRYLIPGLWDMHVHLAKADLPALLAAGVTGVRDMGGNFAELRAWRDAIRSGAMPGPRIVAGGPRLVGPPAHDGPADRVLTAPSDATRVVDSLGVLGADFIKVHEGLSRDVYMAIARAARRRGMPFVGHVPSSISPAEASEAGQRSIEHLEFLPDRCLVLFDGRTLTGALAVPAECDGAHLDALFARLAANGTWLDPTVSMFRAYVSPTAYASLLDRFRRLTPQLRRHRLRILAGTDLDSDRMKPGESLHDELELLVQAGYTPIEVLRAATSDAARFLAAHDSLGSVRRGQLADLVMLAANPLHDVRNARRIELVIRGGRVVWRKGGR